MDILIKNMVLPKQCANCRFCWVDWGERICLIGGIDVEKHYLGKNPTCPLVALPEHGSRCVETNAVVSAITKCFADCKAKGIKPTPFIISVYIGKVPTILEANNE